MNGEWYKRLGEKIARAGERAAALPKGFSRTADGKLGYDPGVAEAGGWKPKAPPAVAPLVEPRRTMGPQEFEKYLRARQREYEEGSPHKPGDHVVLDWVTEMTNQHGKVGTVAAVMPGLLDVTWSGGCSEFGFFPFAFRRITKAEYDAHVND